MPEPDRTIEVVREWVLKAENDLANASNTLRMGSCCPTDTVCFHAQQSVEKYLKALLVNEGIDFPKTHDLERLTALLPKPFRPNFIPEEQALLTDYAAEARYPGWDEILLSEAREAVKIARRIRKQVRTFLPRTAISKRRRLSKTRIRPR